ncbi:hypothetical protein HN51_001290 [Arachis hypogaea]|uniref:Uncharacterized protein LOC107484250 n=1 Tax=Arachis duranensis TaxID=130453 RepID=A0A6P4D192_ARADU|nr:uncharacterized protein LOC107484250 [Arachis duranensis]QHO49360.1 uncharacterized protein DS421_1g13300 [Arachis hypogaea]
MAGCGEKQHEAKRRSEEPAPPRTIRKGWVSASNCPGGRVDTGTVTQLPRRTMSTDVENHPPERRVRPRHRVTGSEQQQMNSSHGGDQQSGSSAMEATKITIPAAADKDG